MNSHKIEERNNEEIDNKYKKFEQDLIEKVRHKRTSDELNYEESESAKKERAEKVEEAVDQPLG